MVEMKHPRTYYSRSNGRDIRCRVGFLDLDLDDDKLGVMGVYADDPDILVSDLAKTAVSVKVGANERSPWKKEYKLEVPVMLIGMSPEYVAERAYKVIFFPVPRFSTERLYHG
jgi:hypothetical protein